MAAPVLPSRSSTAADKASLTLNGTSGSQPQTHRILVLPGDHVGPEVMKEALKVLGVVEDCQGVQFELTHDIVGGCSMDKHGTPVTEQVLQKAKEADAVLFGSVGGPEWSDQYPNPEVALLRLRQHLNAFANIRPCRFYSKSLLSRSPLKPEIAKGTDFIVLRENCGGAYFGPKVEEREFASDTWGYSKKEIENIARVAAALAVTLGKDGRGGGGPATVWSTDKQNVLASSRLWRKVVTEMYEREFPQIELKHQLADSLSMIMMLDPSRFNGIILSDNTFGDMLSDQAGGVVGTLGVLPSASLCAAPGEGTKCNGLYEPVHGSAPDIAGKGIVNPVAQILSTAMMLRYSFGMTIEADAIEKAVEVVLDGKDIGGLEIRSGDLGGTASTSEIGDAICKVLKENLEDVVGGVPKANRLSSLVNTGDAPRATHKDENLKWERKIEHEIEEHGTGVTQSLAL